MNERGSAALEMTLATPVLLVLLMFVVFVGRVVTTSTDVQAAARDGARAASLRTDPRLADEAAREAVAGVLEAEDVRCEQLVVEVRTDGLRPGGSVMVDVTCNVSLRDLSLLGVSGTKRVSGHSAASVDRYRSGT